MKKYFIPSFLFVLLSSIVILFLVVRFEINKFPLKFKKTLENQNDIEIIIGILGKPHYVADKENFHSEIRSNPKNKDGFEVYYWGNGDNSYHYVVVNRNRKVINYRNVGR